MTATPQTAIDQASTETHVVAVDGTPLPPASETAAPNVSSPGGTKSAVSQHALDAARAGVHVNNADGTSLPSAIGNPSPISVAPGGIKQAVDHRPSEAQTTSVGGSPFPLAVSLSTPIPDVPGGPLFDPVLALAADVLDDLERVRTANANRLLILTRNVEDSDGEIRGHGLDPRHPDVARLSALVDLLGEAEHKAVLNLQSAMRAHPLGPWVKARRGVGDKQAARLLAKIGDPYWNTLTGRPRTVSQLWAYCGLHVLPAGQLVIDDQYAPADGAQASDPGPERSASDPGHGTSAGVAARRRRGQRANWSTDAKTRAWLIVESCMKQLDPDCKRANGIGEHRTGCDCSTYRVVLDKRRARTAVTHPDWTPLHSLRDGQRIASKALLRDLWVAARDIHLQNGAPQ